MSSVVPEGWSVYALGELGQVVGGGTPPSETLSYWGGSVMWATPAEITKLKSRYINKTLRTITKEGLQKSSAKLHPKGTILLTSRASIGYPAINSVPMATNQGFQSLRPNEKLDVEYGYQLILNNRNGLERLSAGSTFLEISSKEINKYKLTIPPLPEQKKIASILTSVDEVIENTQKQIDKLQDLKKATMNELLTKGIGHTEFKDSELGRIPKSWEVSLIGEVCEVGTGKKDTQNKMKYGKYPFFVRSQTIERIDSYSFDGEAILTAGDGVGTGKVFHYVNGRFDFHQRVYKLSDFRGGAIGKFLYYCFSSRFLKQVQQFSARGSVESVRMEMITGMAIPLPSIQEQSKIVDCISAIETNISIGKQKLSQTKSLKKSLMQDLLTGKVRVTVN